MVVAFVSALFTALQWKSSERSADAAERSAEAAEESAASTKALTETGQRAWVALQPADVSKDQSGKYAGLNVSLRPHIKNIGLSPAIDVRARATFDQWALPVPDGAPTVDIPTEAGLNLGQGLPGMLPECSLFVTNEHLEEVRRRQRALLFYGECSYRDIFGTPHITRWCLEYRPDDHVFTAFKSELNIMT